MSTLRKRLSVSQVAEALSLSCYTVRKMARLRSLPGAVKVGRDWRFDGDKIERFLVGGEVCR